MAAPASKYAMSREHGNRMRQESGREEVGAPPWGRWQDYWNRPGTSQDEAIAGVSARALAVK